MMLDQGLVELLTAISAGGDVGTMLIALAVLDLRSRVSRLERSD
jgi:hypothetical protein